MEMTEKYLNFKQILERLDLFCGTKIPLNNFALQYLPTQVLSQIPGTKQYRITAEQK